MQAKRVRCVCCLINLVWYIYMVSDCLVTACLGFALRDSQLPRLVSPQPRQCFLGLGLGLGLVKTASPTSLCICIIWISSADWLANAFHPWSIQHLHACTAMPNTYYSCLIDGRAMFAWETSTPSTSVYSCSIMRSAGAEILAHLTPQIINCECWPPAIPMFSLLHSANGPKRLGGKFTPDNIRSGSNAYAKMIQCENIDGKNATTMLLMMLGWANRCPGQSALFPKRS